MLQHLPPDVTTQAARSIDEALQVYAEGCGYYGMLLDPDGSNITLQRLRLPARHNGCGIRSREALAPAAFAANLATASRSFITTAEQKGVVDRLGALFPPPELVRPDQGGRPSLFVVSSLPTATAFGNSWNTLRAEMLGSAITGPLDQPVHNAGHDCPNKLQRDITRQREQRGRDLLQAAIVALDVTDPRRESCQSVDSLSSAWVASWPSHLKGWTLSEREFREVFTTYLGCESPCARALAGLPIQDSRTRRICDSHGRQLCLATLPGDGFRYRHDALVDTVLRAALTSGIPGRTEPRRLFIHAIPQDAQARYPSLGIVPDAVLTINMQRDGERGGAREVLFDVKTISAGSAPYAGRYRLTGGAVAERARLVPGAYETKARTLDRLHYGVEAPAVGLVLTALRVFPPVCGLDFGAFGKASADVHTLVRPPKGLCHLRRR